MKIQLNITVDVEAAIDAAIGQVSSISGVGADGTSEYEITDYDVSSLQADDTHTVTLTVERIEGKFASKDDVTDAIVGELGCELDSVGMDVQW